jgi:Raf kinase inhibitor-like YbhB/YbcL family protein
MFTLSSQGIESGVIADRYGIKSQEAVQGVPQRSLPYEWTGVPEGTKSFALVFQDYDNVPDEGFSWLHWLVADLSANRTALPENASREDKTLIQGINSWSVPYGPYAAIDRDLTLHYGGPAPERKHEYETRLYALDSVLGMKPGFYYNELLRAMEGHILGEAVLKGYYEG